MTTGDDGGSPFVEQFGSEDAIENPHEADERTESTDDADRRRREAVTA